MERADEVKVLRQQNRVLLDTISSVRSALERGEREMKLAVTYPATGENIGGISFSDAHYVVARAREQGFYDAADLIQRLFAVLRERDEAIRHYEWMEELQARNPLHGVIARLRKQVADLGGDPDAS